MSPYIEHLLVGAHAGLGELGILMCFWVGLELLVTRPVNFRRLRIVAIIGALAFTLSWLVGGYYYVVHYGANVKPLIKSGPMPWAHGIFMEAKEHVFLFLPFLSIAVASVLFAVSDVVRERERIQKWLMALCGLAIVIGGLMAASGYIISSGARHALEDLNRLR
jgi:hypothetical protein